MKVSAVLYVLLKHENETPSDFTKVNLGENKSRHTLWMIYNLTKFTVFI